MGLWKNADIAATAIIIKEGFFKTTEDEKQIILMARRMIKRNKELLKEQKQKITQFDWS